MTLKRNICAVVPVKDTRQAKQRLAGVLSAAQRRALALAMCEDVLAALAEATELAGVLVVTVDEAVRRLADRYGAEVTGEAADAGHTAAVAAAAARLTAQRLAMLTLPADIPLLEAIDIEWLIASHRDAGAGFTIVPARDERGSNAVLCAPADAVPLRFGDDSFFPHLAAARSRGLAPQVLRLERIALDIDTPDDLALLLDGTWPTRAHALLAGWRRDRMSA